MLARAAADGSNQNTWCESGTEILRLSFSASQHITPQLSPLLLLAVDADAGTSFHAAETESGLPRLGSQGQEGASAEASKGERAAEEATGERRGTHDGDGVRSLEHLTPGLTVVLDDQDA